MPTTFTKRKRYATRKKAPYRPRKYVRNNKATKARSVVRKTYPIYSSMPGLPITKVVYMPYHMEFTTSSNVITYNTFRSNSIFDPDYTGGGHQPRGHDQWSQYYKYYRVTSCDVKAAFFWEETPSQSHCVGIYLDDNVSFAYTGSLDLYEKGGFKCTKQLLPDRTSRVFIRRRVNMYRMTNKSLMDQRTAFGSNAAEPGPYIHVWTLPNNTAVLSYGAVRVHVALVYRVQLFEPLDILGS